MIALRIQITKLYMYASAIIQSLSPQKKNDAYMCITIRPLVVYNYQPVSTLSQLGMGTQLWR